MVRLFTIVLSIFLSSSLFAQDNKVNAYKSDIEIIKSFINDLSEENRAVDVVLSQHLVVESPSDEIYDYLEVSLEEIRINLFSKKLNEIQYIPYDKMPRKEINDIDPEGLDTTKMYFLKYKNRQMLAVYLENGKIGSFTLVSKGNGKAHFVLY